MAPFSGDKGLEKKPLCANAARESVSGEVADSGGVRTEFWVRLAGREPAWKNCGDCGGWSFVLLVADKLGDTRRL